MSDLISKREIYQKLGEAYNKGYLSWSANEIIKDIIGECDSVENKGDLISRQAVLDEIQKLNRSHIEVAIATLPSVENKGEWIKTKDQYGTYHFTCSKCGNDIATKSDVWNDNFCSECGADMRGKT